MTEMQMVYWAAGILLAATLLALAAHVLYKGLPEGPAKRFVWKIVYELDRAADNMSNKQKRSRAIEVIRDGLGWKRILIPGSWIGLIVDAEVAAIRQMQALTNMPNLHDEGEQK